jgi:hypothetical protein
VPKSLLPESLETRPEPDPRLAPEERVFGLTQGGESRAWPLKSFGQAAEMRKAKLAGQEAVLLWDGRTRTGSAYAPETEGPNRELVTLAVDTSDADSPWVDRETGSRWSVLGRAVSGSRKGQTLRWLPGVIVKWYAWAASYSKTSLEGRKR